MTPEVKQFMSGFRQKIAECWYTDTAFWKDRPRAGKGKSAGQCVVTSLILQEELKNNFDLETDLMLGQVQDTNGEVLIPGHGWLRYQSTIIDTTIDQADGIDLPVFIGTPEEAKAQGIVYVFDQPTEHAEVLAHNETRERYELLKARFS